MKKAALLFSIVLASVASVGSIAQANGSSDHAVTPGDTFSFDVVGFNLASGTGYYLTPEETATFGGTTTYTAVGRDGQNITITSSETVGATSTTDTFTVSTPANFIMATTISGTLINGLQFDLGDSNSGGNDISVLLPINGYTAASSVTYGAGTMGAGTSTTMFGANNLSYSSASGVNSGSATTAISTFGVYSFTYSITYANLVPEPSTWAMLILGAAAGGVIMFRRRQTLA